MELIGACSNPEVQGRARGLQAKLDQIQAGGAAVRRALPDHVLRRRAMAEAIMRVLKASAEPMRMRDIHAEAEALVGQTISRSAVKNWLARQVKTAEPRVVRVGRGRYVTVP